MIKAFVIIIITIALFEVVYRLIPQKSFSGIDYQHLYSETGMNEGGFLKPNVDTLVIGSRGRKVEWKTNQAGFRNSENFPLNKPKNTIRILSIGDSFAAGYRVAQNETYSYILENKLNNSQDSVRFEVMIANIEDPVNGVKYLHNYGLAYNPDIIILGITLGNDLTQTYINLCKYGKYKIENDLILPNPKHSKTKLNDLLDEKLPHETITGYSFLGWFDKLVSLKLIKQVIGIQDKGESIFASRGKTSHYLHDLSHGLGIYLKNYPESIEKTFNYFEQVLTIYANISKNNNIDLKIVLFPQRYQVNKYDLEKTIAHYKLCKSKFDWRKANNRIINFGYQNQIQIFDLTDYLESHFENNRTPLYLPMGDMHWNEEGHKVVGEYLYKYLLEVPLFLKNLQIER